jgi:hypothetical protein
MPSAGRAAPLQGRGARDQDGGEMGRIIDLNLSPQRRKASTLPTVAVEVRGIEPALKPPA